jgi:predicted nucleotidyltransferase
MSDEILNRLKKLKPILREKFGIQEFAVFGSVARGEDDKNSDIDIVILRMKKRRLSLRLEAAKFLEKELNRKVDIGYFDSMKSYIRKKIKEDFVYV